MGFDLVHANGVGIHFRVSDWHKLLELAKEFGWQPEGTIPIGFDRYDYVAKTFGASLEPKDTLEVYEALTKYREEAWDGKTRKEYLSNDGFWVTDSDAVNIAKSLDDALGHIPDHAGPEVEKVFVAGDPSSIPAVNLMLSLGNESVQAPDDSLHAFEYFAGEGKALVVALRDFCREGGFFLD